MAKCIIPLLLFCQNLGQTGPVVQEKTQKNEIFVTVKDKLFQKRGMKLNLASSSHFGGLTWRHLDRFLPSYFRCGKICFPFFKTHELEKVQKQSKGFD